MAHRIRTIWFYSREDAEADQRDKGQPGYSEKYPRGITEGQSPDGRIVYGSKTEEYSG